MSVFNNTKSSFQRLIFPTLFLENYIFDKNTILSSQIKSIKFFFILSDITNLEDIKITNFLFYMNLFLNLQKKPYFKKVFVSKRRVYKIIIIFTFRKDELFNIYEKILFALNATAPIDRKSTYFLVFNKKTQVLRIIIKQLKFFEITKDLYVFPKVFSEIRINFLNYNIQTKDDLEFLLLSQNSIDIEFA